MATDGHVESAQISIFDSILDKTLKIALVVFSVPYSTSALSRLALDEDEDDDGTYDSLFITTIYYLGIPCNIDIVLIICYPFYIYRVDPTPVVNSCIFNGL